MWSPVCEHRIMPGPESPLGPSTEGRIPQLNIRVVVLSQLSWQHALIGCRDLILVVNFSNLAGLQIKQPQ